MSRKQSPEPPFEDVTIEELAARYLRLNKVDRKHGYGGRTASNHFQIALLYLSTGRFQAVEIDNTPLYRIPEWSDFSESNIRKREAESPA